MNAASRQTVLLVTDSSHSIIGEIADGKTNPIAYSAYGQQSAQQEVATRLGFNGQLREMQSSWYLLGNGYRAYNPRLMRFHSPDSWSPFGGGGLNAYMYCVGDPVNRADPTGHGWLSLGAALLDGMGVVMPNTRPMDHVPFGARTGRHFNALNLPNVPDNALNLEIGMRPERSGSFSDFFAAGLSIATPKTRIPWVGNSPGGDMHTPAAWGSDQSYKPAGLWVVSGTARRSPSPTAHHRLPTNLNSSFQHLGNLRGGGGPSSAGKNPESHASRGRESRPYGIQYHPVGTTPNGNGWLPPDGGPNSAPGYERRGFNGANSYRRPPDGGAGAGSAIRGL